MSAEQPDYGAVLNSLNPASVIPMGRLTFPYYYAQVVGSSVDPNRVGCVQARVSGVTDLWEDKFQPWFAHQLSTGMQQVPQKGHWLMVRFLDGDINQGMYYGVSQTKNFLPENFVGEYPDVAVLNMGESDYLYTHNRRTHITTIKNPGNNSGLTWNDAGEITMESSNASDEAGDPSLSVLTEATIDVFTCQPIGSPSTGVRSGSEYLRVPHISKATIDALRGNGSGTETVVKSVQDSEADGQETRELNGRNKTYTIPFMESSASKKRTNKTNKRIILGATGSSPLAAYLGIVTAIDSKVCVHYLVGLGDGQPDILSSLSDQSAAKNLGFIQCADITNDGTYGSDMKGKKNIDAVSIMFYGDGQLNKYQEEKMLDIINHVKKAGNLEEIEVVAFKAQNILDKRNLAALNLVNYEGVY
jgi:hypothetical protein